MKITPYLILFQPTGTYISFNNFKLKLSWAVIRITQKCRLVKNVMYYSQTHHQTSCISLSYSNVIFTLKNIHIQPYLILLPAIFQEKKYNTKGEMKYKRNLSFCTKIFNHVDAGRKSLSQLQLVSRCRTSLCSNSHQARDST